MGGRASVQTIGWWEADIRDGPVIFRKTPPHEIGDGCDRHSPVRRTAHSGGAWKLSIVSRQLNICAKQVSRPRSNSTHAIRRGPARPPWSSVRIRSKHASYGTTVG